MAKFTIALIALLAAVDLTLGQSCGQSQVAMRPNRKYDGGRIVGGVEPRKGSHPWIVSLQQYKSHFCGGSLIRVGDKNESDIVVTAAHCVYDGTSRLTATAGAHDLTLPSGTEQTVEAVKTIYHPQYNPDTTENDIAVVVLKTPIKFTTAVQPVCLPEKWAEVPDNTEATVAGWGLTRENGDTSDVLLQVGVPTINNYECDKMYRSKKMSISSFAMICAGYPQGGKDSCQGDSGGPFVMKSDKGYVLQGVVSFGIGCARPGLPGVYAKVSNYVSWITTQVLVNSKSRY